MKYLLLSAALFVATTASAQTKDSVTLKGHYINTSNGPLKTGGYKPVRQPETSQEASTNKENSPSIPNGTLRIDSTKGIYHSAIKAANGKHKGHRHHRRHHRKLKIKAATTTTVSGKKDI